MRIQQPGSRFNPISGVRNAWDRVTTHPVQTGLGLLGGIFGGPLIGRAVNKGFDWYNDRQFGSAADALSAMGQQQGNRAEQAAWDRPLGGAAGAMGLGGWGHGMPGAGLPMAQSPWSSQPGVQGGWIAPGGILDFLGQSDTPQTPDGTFVSAAPGTAGGGGLLGGFGGGGFGSFGMSTGNGSGFGNSALGSTFGGAPISAMQSIRSGTSTGGGSSATINSPGFRGKVKKKD